MNRLIVVLATFIFLGVYNHSIYSKERHIVNGSIVNLELAPVDPRSLIQGDFMALNYKISANMRQSNLASRSKHENSFAYKHFSTQTAYVVIRLNQFGVGEYVRLDDGRELESSEMKIQFRVRNDRVKFASNAFFFSEGEGKRYDNARYGQFKVNDKGEVLLTALLDENFNEL